MSIPLLAAMARQEGAIDKTGAPILSNRPGRNNNPGDIEYGMFARSHGATGSDGRFATFACMADGYRCMAALLQQPLYKGQTIRVVVYEWLGYKAADAAAHKGTPNEPGNYPEIYIRNVCQMSGLPDSEIIDTHLEIPA